MFEFSAWLRKTFAGAYYGFRFETWLRHTFRRGPRSVCGTYFARPKMRGYRAEVEELETRTVPTGLQLSPINIFQPYNAAAAFTPSFAGGGNVGTPVSVEGQVVVGGEHLLEFEDSVGAADLTHLSATINWSDGTTDTGITSTSTSIAYLEYLGTNGGTTPGTNYAVVTLAAGAHIYDESLASTGANLSYYVSVSSDGVLGGAAGTIQDGTTLNPPNGVADAPLTDTTTTSSVSPLPNQTGYEGVALNNVPIATFNDGDAYAAASDYTVAPGSITVNWGTNVLQSAAPAPTYTLTPIAGGTGSNWEVFASGVVFAEPGTYHPAVTVLDEGGSTVTMPNTETPSFTISDAPLTNTTPANNTANAIEGNAFSATLMTFDDANPYAPLSDFSVSSVTYTNSPTFISGPNYSIVANGDPSGGYSHWQVVATGIIAEEGDYDATVSVHDVDGSNASTTVLDSTTIDVGDAPLTAGTLTVPTGLSEGDTISDQPIFTFTDANPYAPATDYTAVVNPGDGTAIDITSTPGPNGVIVYDAADSTAAASAWIVELSHHYAEEEYAQPFTVQVNDVDGSTTGLVSGTITVTDPPVVLGSPAVTLPTISEGGTTGTQVVATFTDPGGAEFPDGLTAWYQGEGNALDAVGGNNGAAFGNVTYVPAEVGNGFSMDGSLGTYVSAGNQADLQLTSGTIDAWIQTSDASAGFHGIIVKQSAYALFVQNGNLWTFDWNTGTGYDTGVFVADGNLHHVALTFQSGVANGASVYVDGSLVLTTTITVVDQNQAVVLGAGAPAGDEENFDGVIDEAQVFNTVLTGAQVGSIYSAGSSGLLASSLETDYSATIDWGDGTVAEPDTSAGDIVYAGGGVFDVVGSHTYADESTNNDAGAGDYGGVFNIATTVVHELSTPTPTAVTATIEVDDVQITTPVLGALPTDGLEGEALAPITGIATFTDPAGLGDETSASFVATINWGDGATSAGSVTYVDSDGGGANWEVDAPSHTYVEAGSYSLTVTVQHDAEPALTSAPSPIVIADPPVVVTGVGNITPVEGEAFSGVVATFTDPGGDEGLAQPGLTHWFPGQGNANDSTGGTTGLIIGPVSFAPGQVGEAFSFPGTDGVPASTPSVSYPASDFAPGTSDFSVAFGLQTDYTPSVAEAVLGDRSDASNGNFFGVRMTPSGILIVEEDEDASGTNYAEVQSTAPINDGVFHQIVITRTATALSLYIDGMLDASTATTAAANLTANGGANAFVLGAEQGAASGFTEPYTGLLDEVQIFSQALTPVQVAKSNIAFLDGNAPEYAAVINWGDGTSSVGAISGPDSSGVFTVTGTHTYAEESDLDTAGSYPSYLISVNVQHPAGGAANPVANPSFESGLTSWTVVPGGVAVAETNLGNAVVPTDGAQFALLQTADDGSFGSDTSGFQDQAGDPGTEGTVMTQTFSADAGTTIFVDYNFLSNDYAAPLHDDFGEGQLLDDLGNVVATVFYTDVAAATSSGLDSGYIELTGWQTASVVIPATGTYTLRFVASNVGDNVVKSALAVDDIRVSGGATDTATVSDPPILFTPVPVTAIPIFGTGLDGGGTPLAGGANDPHFTVNDGTEAVPAVVVTNAASYWSLPNTGTSQWISADTLATTGNGAGETATFDYQTSFDLTGFNPATAQLFLNVAADDYVTEIELNGVDTGIIMPAYPAFNPWTFFTPATISSGFVPGINTLDIIVSNSAGGPTGLQVQLSGTAAPDSGTVTPVALRPINEGGSTGVVPVATFTDPGTPGGEPVSSYNATINWGDGTSSPGIVVPSQDVLVNVYTGLSNTEAGAPYSGYVGSFTSPDIQFLTDNGDNWFPLTIPADAAFGADIVGNLDVAATGTYSFDLNSDDGSELFIDGSLVVDNGGNHGPTDVSGNVTLTAGAHTFEVQFFNGGGPAGVDLNLPEGVSYGPAGAFTVYGSHTYAEESTNNDGGPGDIGGVYQISTTVLHELSAPTPTAVTATIQVNDVPVVLTNSATNVNYSDFAHGPNTDQLELNGSTETVDSWAQQEFFDEGPPPYAQPVGNVLQLTDGYDGSYGYLFGGGEGEAGSAFAPTPISTTASFTTQFQFEAHGGTPVTQGEGITFTIAGVPFELGNVGTDLGYGGNEADGPGGGIDDSVAIGFQLASNTVDIFQDGVVTADMPTNPGFSLFGAPVNVWLAYDYDAADPAASTLAVYVSQGTTQPATPLFTANVELDTVIGAGNAYVGFTAGSDSTAVQDIRSWQLSSPVILATEGQATAVQTLATFTDPGNVVPAGQILAVNIGSGGNGFYDGNTTVTFSDPTSPGASGATGTVDVYNGFITGVTITSPGSGYDADTIVTFSDPTSPSAAGATGSSDPSVLEEPPGDYTVLVNWGDGAGFVSDPNVTVSQGDPLTGVYSIIGSHAYAEEGDYTLQVEVIHENTAPQFVSEPVIVADVQLTEVTAGGPETVNEGSTGNTLINGAEQILIATFNDPGNPLGLTEDYSADINFGDGSGLLTNYPISVVYDGGTTFSVYAEHVYEWTPASEGSYTLTATIHHAETPDAAEQPISDDITVTDPALVATAGPNFNGIENSSTNLVVLATFNDPGDPTGLLENPHEYLATVTWGDGATSTSADGLGDVLIVALGDGNYVVEGSHVYADQSPVGTPYTVTTTVQETDNAETLSNAATESATIADTAVDGTGGFVIATVEGAPSTVQTVATFTDPGGAEAPDNYVAFINWGDGSAATLGSITYADGVFTVQGSHTYAEEGEYTISTVISHGAAPDTTVISTATVSDPSVILNSEPFTFSVAEGASTTQTVATFTDPGGPESLTEYSALINWGDGTPETAGVITYDATTQTFTVDGTHTYAQYSPVGDPYVITTTVSHGSSVPVSTEALTGELVSNGGFETGDLTGWSGEGAFVDGSFDGYTPQGNFSAYFGEVGSLGAISQTIPTIAGAQYTLSYYMGSDGGTPNEFRVLWNGGVIYDQVDIPAQGFTLYTFTVTATSSSTPIEFDGRNDPGYFALDDVSVAGSGNAALATVTDPAVNASGATLSAVEGADVPPQVVATFSDPGGAEAVGHYTADIDWTGTGASYQIGAGVVSFNATTNSFIVTSQADENTFIDEGSYPILVRINHDIAAPTVVTSTVVVSDPSVIATATPISPVEGESFTGTVATFTDPGGNQAAEFTEGDYSATVNWGDGTAPTIYTPGAGITLSGTTFTVTGTHTYAEEGAYFPSITITHGTSTSVTVSGVATVSDPSVVLNTTPLAFSAVEGAASLSQAVATFTDPGGAEGLTEYAAVINWGDGSAPSTGTITYSAGTFTVWGAHTYAEASPIGTPYSITVTVDHGTSTPSVGITGDATVSDPSVILNATPLSFTAVEGATSALQTVATFTDPGGPEVTGSYPVETPVVGAYTAYINWNDPFAPGAVLVPSADLTFNAITQTFYVLGSHDYPEEGVYRIDVTVFHGTSSGAFEQGTSYATVSDPSVIGTGGFIVHASEGTLSAVQTLATFTDPGDPTGTVESGSDYSATVNWGDGTATTTLTEANGGITFNAGAAVFTVAGGHDYAQEGTYQITILLHHDAAPDVAVADTAIVTDPSVVLNSPALTLGAVEGQQFSGIVATFTDPGTPEEPGDYNAVIAWGDGSTTNGLVGQTGPDTYDVTWFHTYTSAGSDNITVTVSHGTSTPSTGVTATVTVSDPSVLASGGLTLTGVEGAPIPTQTVATFTDPGGAEPIDDYSADIDWTGTGASYTIGAGTVRYNAANNTFAVTAGGNTFIEEGTYTILVRINHETSTPVVVADTVVVSDPAVVGTGGFAFTAVEGSLSASQTLATFTDPGGNLAAEFAEGDYSASVNWGDATALGTRTPANGGITFNAATGVFTVVGQHDYAEEGTDQITVVLQHGTAPSVTVTDAATVSDPSVILNTPPLTLTAVKGQQFSGTVATFTDPGGAEAVGEYSASIAWGDGNTTPGLISLIGADSYSVSLFHTYTEEGSDSITVTVSHGTSTPATGVTATITVTDPSVLASGGLTLTGVEGAPIPTQTVATFTDPGGSDPIGAYSADIDWTGTGTSYTIGAGTIRYNANNNTFTVTAGGNTFVPDGTYTILIRVNHGTSTPVVVSDTVVVSDPAVIGTGGFAITAVEGTLSTSQILATFTDPGGNAAAEFALGNYSASVNWGDGTAIGTRTTASGIAFNAATGVFTVTGAHDYAHQGTYQITVVLHHDVAPDATVTDTATVSVPSVILNSTPLAITAVEGQQFFATVATFTDPGTPEPPGDYSASIAWGDGNTTPGLISQTGPDAYQVSLYHTYANAGSYNITVTVSHGTSSPAAGITAVATVSDPSVVLNATPVSFNGTEGLAFSNQPVATFTDPGGAEPVAGNYSASINWGDGVGSSAGTILFSAATQTFTVYGGYLYTQGSAAGSPYQVTVTVSHGTSTPVSTVTALATIIDPAVIVTGNFELTAQRGIVVPAQTVATFTDPGGPELIAGAPNPADYSATVNWGDSTPTVSLPISDITYAAGTQTFTVSAGGHTYTQNGNFTITVAVTHPATTGSTVTVSSYIAVVDPSVILNSPALNSPSPTITALVNTHISNQKVATFTDPGGAEVIGGFPVSGAYTAYINWGDGTAVTTGTISYSSSGAGTFTVSGSHTYTVDSSGQTNGVYPIVVTVAHGNSTPIPVTTATAKITDPAVLLNGNKSVSGVEGSAPASPWLLATFTDPGFPRGIGTGYTVAITWGDTTNSAGTVSFDSVSGKWDVYGSHAYSSFGSYTVQVSVTHGGATTGPAKDTATIADAPLTAGTLTPPAAPMNIEAPTGSTPAAQQVLFKFTDANTSESGSNFTATVSWGDATSTSTTTELNGTIAIVSLGGGAFEVKGTHVYTEDYLRTTFSVSVKDAGGAKAYASGSLTVTDPSVVLNTTPLAFISVVNVLSDIQAVATFTDPGGPEVLGGVPKAGEYSALINWGDGTAPSNGIITYSAATQTFTVSGAHRYGAGANVTYQITVTVAHGNAAPATGVTATTTVAAAKLNQTITFPTPTGTYAPAAAVQTVTIPLAAVAYLAGTSTPTHLPIAYTVHSITLVAGTGSGSIISATISGNSLVLKIAANTSANFNIVLYANQPGDLNYNAAPQVAATLSLTNNRRGSGG